MSNLQILEDYIVTLQHQLFEVLSSGDNLLTLAVSSIIIVASWYLAKPILKKAIHHRRFIGLSEVNFFLPIIKNIIFPTICLLGFIIYSTISFFVEELNTTLLYYITLLNLALIIIRTLNAVINYTFNHKSYVGKFNIITSFILWVIALIWVTDTNDNVIKLLNNLTIHFGKGSTISLWGFFHGLAIIIIAFIFAMFLARYTERKISELTDVDSNIQQIINRVSKIAIVILAIIVTLPIIGIDMTALSVFGGAIGVGIGFGLQKIASNFLSGFIILFDRSIKVGDRLIVDNNTGTVSHITTRYVVLARADGTEVLIPNEKFVTDTIQNQSYSNTNLRIELTFCISDSADVAKVIELIQETIVATPEVLSTTPSVAINRLIPSGVEIKAYYWVENSSYITKTSNHIYLEIIKLFKTNNIYGPITSQEINIINQRYTPDK